ncbi:MAG: hypothetical protein PHC97_03270 [Patescibacteria group bacterium]|nr:hypothetical protein [Patescibacteria group bacterium]
MSEIKFVCPFCGFESNGAGVCPTCDEVLEKRCLCQTGDFSNKCCEEEAENGEKNKEKLMEAELSSENLSEIVQRAKKKAEEEAELENVKPVDEDEE